MFNKTLLIAASIAVLTPAAFAYMTSFSDVSPNAWYADSVLRLADQSILEGYEDGTYKPDQYVNRAELAVMLDRIQQQTNGSLPFMLYRYTTPNMSDWVTYTNEEYQFTLKHPSTYKITESEGSIFLDADPEDTSKGGPLISIYTQTGGTPYGFIPYDSTKFEGEQPQTFTMYPSIYQYFYSLSAGTYIVHIDPTTPPSSWNTEENGIDVFAKSADQFHEFMAVTKTMTFTE